MAHDGNCIECGTKLTDSIYYENENRAPCPNCGSLLRNYVLQAEPANYKIKFNSVNLEYFPKSLLLQAVISAPNRTNEGNLIEKIEDAWVEIVKHIELNPRIAFEISDRKWEEIIAGAYFKAGYEEVTITPRSGDFGRDVIAVKKGFGEFRVVVQVKAYKPDHLVTANDVRALLGVLHGDGASKGILTTTSDFAPRLSSDPLITPLIPSKLELINGKTLFTYLSNLSKKKT